MNPRLRLRPTVLHCAMILFLLLTATAGVTTASPAGGAGATVKVSNLQGEGDRTLIIAVPTDVQNLDPTLSGGDVMTQEVLTAVYSYLIDFAVVEENGRPFGDPNNFVGDVAESFETSPDGLTVTFRLRPDIKFSNGDP